MVEVTNTPFHSHVGTTVFNNFSNEYDLDLGLEEEVEQLVISQIELAGLEPVILGDFSGIAEIEKHISGLDDGEWTILNEREMVARIRNEYNLDALVRIWPIGRHVVSMECSSLGCSSRYADGMGLYSRGILGLLLFYAVPGVSYEVIMFDPLFELSTYKPMSKLKGFGTKAVPISNFDRPEKLRELSEDDWMRVRESLIAHFEELAEAIALTLTTNPQ